MAAPDESQNFDSEKCCSVCGIIDNLKRCGKCLSTWYCSRDHQRDDWKNHKAVCQELQRNSVTSEGTTNMTKFTNNGNTSTVNSASERNHGNGATDCRSTTVGDVADSQTGTSPDKLNNSLTDRADSAETTSEDVKPKQNKKKKKKKSKAKLTPQAQSTANITSPSSENLNNQVSESDETMKAKDTVRNGDVKPRIEHDKKYDPRPFCRTQFPVLKDRSLDCLTKHIAEQLQQHCRCVVDDLLPINVARAIRVEVEKLHERGSFVDGPLSGGKASSDNSKKYSEKSIRSDKITWLTGKETDYPHICQYMKHLDCIVQKLNGCLQGQCQISGRTKAMVACYPGNGTGYAYHVDNPNKDGRILTFLYYLNEGWDTEKLGGNLRIMPPDGGYVDIEPILNRLFVFWSDRRNPHEVQPAWASRYAITMWYFDKEEREAARRAQQDEETAVMKNNLAQLELRAKTEEKASLEKEIKKQSQGAVGNLTEDELQAFALLVEGSPNPRQTLTDLKVAPEVQDALLRQLTERKK